MDFYTRLDILLKEKGITRKALCTILQIPYETLNSMIKRQSQSISFDILQKIAVFFDTTTDYLTGFSDHRYKVITNTGNSNIDDTAAQLINSLKPLYEEARLIGEDHPPWIEPETSIYAYVLKAIDWIAQDIRRLLDMQEDLWEDTEEGYIFKSDTCNALLNTRFYEEIGICRTKKEVQTEPVQSESGLTVDGKQDT